MIKKNIINHVKYFGAFCLLPNATLMQASSELQSMYQYHCSIYSDIYEHIPVLKKLSQECTSVTEIGIRSIVSTWGVLLGLAENSSSKKVYVGIDLDTPPDQELDKAQRLAEQSGINFKFIQANDMHISLEQTDMLFIDSLHTYCHLTYELEAFAPFVSKYITLHDTSAPWGHQEDMLYKGDYSEYPSWIDRTKRGLWPAVEDFLARHSDEWALLERKENNHGFTILKRIA